MHTIHSPRSIRLRLRGGILLIVSEVGPGRSIAWWRTRRGDVLREAWSALC